MKIQAQGFLGLIFDAAQQFSSSTLKRHLLNWHLTLSDSPVLTHVSTIKTNAYIPTGNKESIGNKEFPEKMVCTVQELVKGWWKGDWTEDVVSSPPFLKISDFRAPAALQSGPTTPSKREPVTNPTLAHNPL